MLKYKTIVFLQIAVSLIYCSTVLAESDSTTWVEWPGTPAFAKTVGKNWAMPDAPKAQGVWNGAGKNPGCDMNIVVSKSFTPLCLNENLTIHVKAALFTLDLNGYHLDHMYYDQYPWNGTVETTGVPCGSSMTIRINATNLGSNCSPSNTAYIIFAVLSPGACMPVDTTSYYDPAQCLSISCSSVITGCLSCTSGPVCTAVINNTYVLYTNSTVGLCSEALPYCSLCNSQTQCTGCINTSYALSKVKTVTSCELCGTMIAGCLTCSDNATCLTCDPANLFVLNSSNKCQCLDGYYLDGLNCVTCGSVILGCTNCTAGPLCTQCDSSLNMMALLYPSLDCVCIPGYYMSGTVCLTCDSAMAGCLECSSMSVCTKCNNGYYLNGVTCQLCSSAIIGCFSCQNSTSCTQCDSSLSMMAIVYPTSGCQCMTGYILSGTSCLTCSSLIPGCLDCLSGPLCLNCDSSQYMMAPVYPSANCFCITGYYFNGTNCQTCSSAMAGCLECSSGSICTNCILSMPLINDVCTCSVGYSIVNLTCVQICGDGKLFDYECDDGNTVSGDGCSSTCTIEDNYACINGSSSSPSVCSPNQLVSLILVNTIKDPSANKVTFYFSLSPVMTALNNVDFMPLLQCDLPNTNLTASYDGNGRLEVTAYYASSIQGANAIILFNPAAGAPALFATPVSKNYFTVNPTNNLAADVYDQSAYDSAKLLSILAKVVMGLALIGFVASLFTTGKFIGVEMLGVVQASFIGLIVVDQMTPGLSSLSGMMFVNGVNTMYSDSKTNLLYGGTMTSDQTPLRISAQEYGSQVAYSFNYTLILLLLPPLVALSMFIASKIIKVQEKKDKLAAWSWLALCEFGITAVFFVMYHFVTSLAVFAGYCRTSSELFPISIAQVALVLLVSIPILILFKTHPKHFGDYRAAFKQGTLNQMHYWLIALARILLAVMLVALNSVSAVGFVAMILPLALGTYVAVRQPYISKPNNIRAACNEGILAIILGLYGFCRVSATAPSFVAYIVIGLLLIVIIGNIAMMIKQFIESRKGKQNGKVLQTQQKMAKYGNQEDTHFKEEMRKRFNSLVTKGIDVKLSNRQRKAPQQFQAERVDYIQDTSMMDHNSSRLEVLLTEKLLAPKAKNLHVSEFKFSEQEAKQIGLNLEPQRQNIEGSITERHFIQKVDPNLSTEFKSIKEQAQEVEENPNDQASITENQQPPKPEEPIISDEFKSIKKQEKQAQKNLDDVQSEYISVHQTEKQEAPLIQQNLTIEFKSTKGDDKQVSNKIEEETQQILVHEDEKLQVVQQKQVSHQFTSSQGEAKHIEEFVDVENPVLESNENQQAPKPKPNIQTEVKFSEEEAQQIEENFVAL